MLLSLLSFVIADQRLYASSQWRHLAESSVTSTAQLLDGTFEVTRKNKIIITYNISNFVLIVDF